jgi:hypothetical protein
MVWRLKHVWADVSLGCVRATEVCMRKVIAWVLLFGILGIVGFGTTQLAQPTPMILADDPKTGAGGG